MRVLLLNQFFWPDSAATSQLLTDLATGLKDLGHEVHVICAAEGYALSDASADDPGVIIHRVNSLPFVRGKLGRALSYASFFVTSALRGLLIPRVDLVITLTTPPLLSIIGTALKILRGSRHFIWEMDVYPDVAVDLNYIKAGGLVQRMAGLLLDFSRLKSDGIVALGECMQKRLVARGIPVAKIHVADNWADGKLIRPVPRRLSSNSLTLLYSGNLGLAHDVDTILATMEELRTDSRFRFVFAGGGPLRNTLEAKCQQAAIYFADFQAYSERQNLGERLANCDLGLITQRETCLGSVVPSKIYGLLAAARPVVFIGPAESTVATIIKRFKCGWQIDNGDTSGLVSLLKILVNQPARLQAAGVSARAAFEAYYDRSLGVARVCTLVGASTPAPDGTPQPTRPSYAEL
jgi:colanic acid biosynthesis glycosyl transferase WcaI